MALTEKQKTIISKNVYLRKDRTDPDSKSFFDILMTELSAQQKIGLIDKIKAELIRRKDVKIASLKAEKGELEK